MKIKVNPCSAVLVCLILFVFVLIPKTVLCVCVCESVCHSVHLKTTGHFVESGLFGFYLVSM